ncbi:MAG: SGNH hydrolase domain-containing protein [Actinobacteria bacterium]|nr:SGNH hydrolase domain-containing protein [Actinomycetota bacterium]
MDIRQIAGFTTIVVLSSSYLLLYPPRADTANAQKVLLENFPSQIRIDRIGSCYVDYGQSFTDFPVSCDPSEQSGSIVIMGDSHAATFAEGLRQTFKSVGEYTSSLCPPFINAVRPDRPNCKAANDSAFAHIKRVQPDSIILSANWWPYALFYSDTEISDYLTSTIDYLNAISPHSKIYLFGGLPLWLPNLSDQILRSNIPFVSGGKVLNTNLARIRKNDAIVKAVAERKGASFISSIEHLCDANDQCIALIKGKDGHIEPYVYDAAHLTPTASFDLIQRFRAAGQL